MSMKSIVKHEDKPASSDDRYLDFIKNAEKNEHSDDPFGAALYYEDATQKVYTEHLKESNEHYSAKKACYLYFKFAKDNEVDDDKYLAASSYAAFARVMRDNDLSDTDLADFEDIALGGNMMQAAAERAQRLYLVHANEAEAQGSTSDETTDFDRAFQMSEYIRD